ncbi:MAG: family 16 glycoside hydrolase, partial [Ginsengibacter sp.]
MKIIFAFLAIFFCIIFCGASLKNNEHEWISLFDGKSLNGWKVGNHPETFKVEDGKIVVNGETAHLFYIGEVKDHNFKNFEFKTD